MKDSDFSSPDSDLNDASERFIDASLRGVAEDLRQNDTFLDSVESRLDQVDREEITNAVPAEPAGEPVPAGRSWWWVGVASAAAVAMIAFGIQKYASMGDNGEDYLAMVEPLDVNEDPFMGKTASDPGETKKNLSQSFVEVSKPEASLQENPTRFDEPADPAEPATDAPEMSLTAVMRPESSQNAAETVLRAEGERTRNLSPVMPQEATGLIGPDAAAAPAAPVTAPSRSKSMDGEAMRRPELGGALITTGRVATHEAREVAASDSAPISLSKRGVQDFFGAGGKGLERDASIYTGLSVTGSGSADGVVTSVARSGSGVWMDRTAAPKEEGQPARVGSGERYGALVDNRFVSPLNEPLSTFSVDVDTASYTNLRRLIQSGSSVPPDAVRIEEMINYFSYDYPQPDGEHPFAFALEAAACPWNGDHQLLRVGIQGEDLEREERPNANLVFLLDVSGSMNSADKLPLVKQSMSLLVEELTENDCVSIVVYAGAEGLALPATPGSEQARILRSLDRLKSGGSTNGGAGIQLAYQMAAENYIEEGINRVILCTDGDFNVGKTGDGDLVKLVQRKAKTGVFLSVLGFGTGNINDSMMEKITNEGNGTYYYVDSFLEARKVFLQDLMGTLVTIAKDVKIQVEFNPARVQSYRLIGYANRMLEAEDFENDKVDAGEVGAGHAVTALYEIVPTGVKLKAGDVANPNTGPALRYQKEERPPMKIVDNGELATVKLRYKRPDADTSIPMQASVVASDRKWKKASDDFQFSAAVALFGLGLRGGEFAGSGTIKDVIEMAEDGMGADAFGRREEFVQLIQALRPQIKD